MLTRRTNVLLEEEDYLTLVYLSHQEDKTIGELVRHAVKKTYKIKKIDNREKILLKKIKEGWKFLKNPEIPVDYKALVEYGRKY
ncbi:MAG: hypothetical protein NTV24_01780 [Candidatus Woesebacteria bacterium]|nr:hypothetical protein [Candidatus Woesebacteria bacterium]